MKKNVLRVLALAVLMCLLTAFVSAEEVKPVYVMLNGEYVDCASYGQEATIVEGRTMVPLRAIFEALGADVIWDKNTRTVLSARNGTLVELGIGSNILVKNGQDIEIDVPAQIMNGRTMVPARAIAESFGVAVEWDKHTRTVLLTSTDKTNIKSNADFESVLRDSKVYSIFNYGMTMQECWDLISHESANKELVAFRDGRAEIHISKNLDKFEYADSEITGDCDIIFIRLLFEGDYLYSVYVISNYCDTLEESLEALEPIVEYYGSDYESDPRYDDSDDTRCYTWKNENEKVECDFSDVYESATDVNSRLGNNYTLFLTDIQAKAQIDENEVQPKVEPSETPAQDDADVPEEAKETLEKTYDAMLSLNLNEAAKYSTMPEVISSLNISGIDDLLSAMGYDRDTLSKSFLTVSEADAETFHAFSDAVADISIDVIKGTFGRMDYAILSYNVVSEDRIEFECAMYLPDMSTFEEDFGVLLNTVIESATYELMYTVENIESKTEKEIYDLLAPLMRKHAEPLVAEFVNSIGVYTDGETSSGALVKVNGAWFVEVDEEDIEGFENLKNNGFGIVG